MLENPGRGIGKNSKKRGTPKEPFKAGNSTWWLNHNTRKNIYTTKNIYRGRNSKENILEYRGEICVLSKDSAG
jgi:hypothetical protein